MSETRKVLCKIDPTEVLAEVTLPDKTSEEQWALALAGYLCDSHGEKAEVRKTLEDQIDDIKTQFEIIKTDVEILKAKAV